MVHQFVASFIIKPLHKLDHSASKNLLPTYYQVCIVSTNIKKSKTLVFAATSIPLFIICPRLIYQYSCFIVKSHQCSDRWRCHLKIIDRNMLPQQKNYLHNNLLPSFQLSFGLRSVSNAML